MSDDPSKLTDDELVRAVSEDWTDLRGRWVERNGRDKALEERLLALAEQLEQVVCTKGSYASQTKESFSVLIDNARLELRRALTEWRDRGGRRG